MDIKEAIKTRRTVHSYLNEEIDQKIVTDALELALNAPNHKFTFPWKFILLGTKAREEIAKVMLGMFEAKNGKPESEEKLQAIKAKINVKMVNPAAIVAFVLPKSESAFTEREDYASVACAIQNFTLALKADQWDSKWSTGGMTRHDDTHKALGLDVSKEEIVGFVMVGHSAIDLPPRRRPALDDTLIILD